MSLLCVGATSKLKLSYGKCFYKKFNFLSRAIFGPIFGPNTNINIFEKSNFQYLYLNIQYSETNIRISEYIHIFALYNTNFLIKYEYEYIRKVKFPIFVFEYPIFGVKSLNIRIYSPYTGWAPPDLTLTWEKKAFCDDKDCITWWKLVFLIID